MERVTAATGSSSFEGNDEWIRQQLRRDAAKRKKKLLLHTQTSTSVRFDRQEFTQGVKEIMGGDVRDGFVIGLKRRRELALQLCHDYKFFNAAQKLDLVLALAVDLGIRDLSMMVKTLPSIERSSLVLNVMAASLGFQRENDPNISKSIKRGLVPLAEQFFLLVGSIPPGPKFLLRLRVDLALILKQKRTELPKSSVKALELLDVVMRDLFATQAGMRFRRIEPTSEKLMSFVLCNERVHAVRSWKDLDRRISGPNRFCYGLFHMNMPESPLVFVEVMVMDHLCSRIDSILENEVPTSDRPQTHAIFYSVSNANGGLRGLNIASHLLFLTMERVTSQFPHCQVAATLSPVPGFAHWFQTALRNAVENQRFFSEQQAQRLSVKFGVTKAAMGKWLLKQLSSANWHQDDMLVAAIGDIMTTACARYALFERKGDKILDSVANFHLQNGAQVEQINFLADTTPHALSRSFSMMINYRYCMTSVDVTSASYMRNSSAALSPAVARLLWPSSSVILDEIERIAASRNIPLFAHVYRPRETICARGSLPTAVYFVCAGKVRVSAPDLYSLADGSVFGEREALGDEPVPYNVTAETTTHMLLLPRSDLQLLLPDSPVLQKYAEQVQRERHHPASAAHHSSKL